MASVAELETIVARLGATVEESERKRDESERKLIESAERLSRKIAESMDEAVKSIGDSIGHSINRLISRAMDQYVANVSAEREKTERMMQRLEKNIGGLNNSIGEIVEMIIIPGIIEKMNILEHNFTVFSPRKEYFDTDNRKLTEVDLLLENCGEVMAVEVKTQVSRKWVERHLKRLEILRKRESITGMRGKTMYAAVAGVNFDADARELAAGSGMYLIDINEETDRITVEPPAEVRTW